MNLIWKTALALLYTLLIISVSFCVVTKVQERDTASTPIKLEVNQTICFMATYSANGVEITPCEE